MLENDFYYLRSLEIIGQKITAIVFFNSDHRIFTGHFPGHPVVPGVCMIRIVKEVIEKGLNQRVRLKKAENIKFLSVISPRQLNDINLQINFEGGLNETNASLSKDNTVFFKFIGTFESI
jgi:3-hydroxyacyl-[acyl-carrier-protein] dehydratase